MGDKVQCLAFINAVPESKSPKPVKFIEILKSKTFTAEILSEKQQFSSIFFYSFNTDLF